MTKIMLVEDDNNLREIYEARLLAEGYEIVSAKDGEEALALAIKEKPDLIISDVMMPKISGFDMLDILRSTPEIKTTKVIMMTALSQAEDKARADRLGADRYLVKSQVTLEDVARVAREVLTGEADTPIDPPVAAAVPPPTAVPAATMASPPPPTQIITPAAVAVTPVAVPPTFAVPAAPTIATPPPIVAPAPVQVAPLVVDEVNSPASDPSPLDATPAFPAASASPYVAQTSAQESADMNNQIKNFVDQPDPVEAPPQISNNPAPVAVPPPAMNITPAPVSSPAQPPTTPPNVETITVQTPPPDSTSLQPQIPSVPVVTATPTANDNVQTATPPPAAPPTDQNATENNVPVAHKKVIQPLNTLDQSAPNLNDLLVKEQAKDALAPGNAFAPAPTNSVVQPGGATVTPATPGGTAAPSQPGNVVQPGPGDPASIAL